MSESHPPPSPNLPSQPSSISSHSATMMRNIITGVITTVVGAGALYLLKFNKSGDSQEASFLIVKEATTNAWKSYVSAENVFFNNMQTYQANYSTNGFDHYREATLGEFEHFKSDLKRIQSTKNLDPSFQSMLEQRLKINDESADKYRQYLDNYNDILKNTSDVTERNKKLDAETQRFIDARKERDQLFENSIDELCKTLTDKYSGSFAKTSLVMYGQTNQTTQTTQTTNTNTNTGNNSGTDASITNNANNNSIAAASIDWRMLVGKWINGTDYLYQYQDGKMYYYFGNTDSTYGSWQLYNNQLYHYYNQYYGAGNRWVYNISNITGNSLSITLVDSPYTRYNFVRSNN
ncbi:MAG: hypothetical protein JST17_02170 [Bacteroidetes bacterium]|nr:hypothetical protein [Bacteroidota bacterium]MBS1931367.1 hypothetical protein [Bacteroidota bacterium]